jgi:hypothetical protein
MTADHVVVAVELGLEGTLERIDSAYELGERSGAWITYRTNMAQEFASGGYIPGGHGFAAFPHFQSGPKTARHHRALERH